MKILIAEDEKQIADSLKKNLVEEKYEVALAADGVEALKALEEDNFDLILLDWRMPKKNGIEALKEIRDKGSNIPVILITVYSNISNKVEALKLGADDYITKPFSFQEVLARIEAVMRRHMLSKKFIEFNGFKLNILDRIIESDDSKERLTEKEFDLLKFFLSNRGKIISRERLCKDVWELNFIPQTNTIEVTIKNLRKKLEEFTGQKFIKTIYGEGYLFISE